MKLLYDVLQYDPPAIKRAVLYATNNALVCETAEDANKVAYELGDNKRYDVSQLSMLKRNFFKCYEIVLIQILNFYYLKLYFMDKSNC